MRILGTELPQCNDRRGARCFAYGGGECSLLTSAYPAGKLCPFFKTQWDYEEARKTKKQEDDADAG